MIKFKRNIIKNTLVLIKRLTFLVFLMVVLPSNSHLNNSKTTHKVAIIHPAIDIHKPIECFLVEEILPNKTKQFYLDVDSVNCGENICEVITVRMFWDELGRYVKYELEQGEGLEKKEGVPFTAQDYKKLEWVLNNKDSELKSMFKNDLVASDFVEHGNVNVDAVSGATSTITPNEIVEGAVWTCFTLWHWANGEIKTKIREINSNQLTRKSLIDNYLLHQKEAYKKFAIESLQTKQVFDTVAVLEIEKAMLTSSYPVFKTGLQYVENLSEEKYYQSMLHLFNKGDDQRRIACLNAVSKTSKKENEFYYHQLSGTVQNFNYQEMEVFLTSVKLNKFIFPVLTEKLIILLKKSDNFLIARRAYWFLSDQETLLTKKQKRKLKKFKKKYKNRL